jgi:hypothetical protein
MKVVGKSKPFTMGLNYDIIAVVYIYWLKVIGMFASSIVTWIYKQTALRVKEHV